MTLRNTLKPRLMAQLPQPCPRCGQVMSPSMKLDLGHISRHPSATFEPTNLRLEHRACNRKDGQRITAAKRRSHGLGARLGRW